MQDGEEASGIMRDTKRRVRDRREANLRQHGIDQLRYTRLQLQRAIRDDICYVALHEREEREPIRA